MAEHTTGTGVAAARHRVDRLREVYELAHLGMDFVAGVTFVAGSALFFDPAWEPVGVWLFLVGSLAFAAKPTIRLAHMLADRRVRRLLAAELSDEAMAELHRLRPRTPLRPFRRG